MTENNELEDLFQGNREWRESILQQDPDFFSRLSAQQSPEYLWIGCSDSRVPANQIMGRMPGEVFVHRNVSNLVLHTDLNCLAVMQFAVEVLRVRHVLVCGHYGCGGIRAALEKRRHGLIDNWLRQIQAVAAQHRDILDALPDDEARVQRLCELNVVEQVLNVSRTTVFEDAWERGQPLTVHGVIYHIEDGLLRPVGMHGSSSEAIAAAYPRAIATPVM